MAAISLNRSLRELRPLHTGGVTNKRHEYAKYSLANIIYLGLLLWKVRTDWVDLVCAAFVKVERSNKVCRPGSDYGASVLLFHKYRHNSTRSAPPDWLMPLFAVRKLIKSALLQKKNYVPFLLHNIFVLCESTEITVLKDILTSKLIRRKKNSTGV